MPIFLLLLMSLAHGEALDVRSLNEKTYTRDNTYCHLGKQILEIQIRSHARHTESVEKAYGEYIFSYKKKKSKILPLNVDRLDNYRFFPGRGTLCSKSLGFLIDKERLAVLFLKENRPFMDKLSLQLLDIKTTQALEVIETPFTTDKAQAAPGGFIFRTYAERHGLEMGKVKIQETEYFFQDRDFPYWMKYTGENFEAEPSASYRHSPWKKYFKDEQDYLSATGWDAIDKKFKNAMLYIAVNHKDKKQCLLLSPTKIKISGSENWRCL